MFGNCWGISTQQERRLGVESPRRVSSGTVTSPRILGRHRLLPAIVRAVETFLIGGGRDAQAAHEPFVRACGGGRIVAYVLDDDDLDVARWEAALKGAGAADVTVVPVSLGRPPRAADLVDTAGIYVAGGLTPSYRDVLVGAGTDRLDAARTAGLAYCGFSAGAAIAGDRALVGGWRTEYKGGSIAICDAELGEDLETLTVLPGSAWSRSSSTYMPLNGAPSTAWSTRSSRPGSKAGPSTRALCSSSGPTERQPSKAPAPPHTYTPPVPPQPQSPSSPPPDQVGHRAPCGAGPPGHHDRRVAAVATLTAAGIGAL